MSEAIKTLFDRRDKVFVKITNEIIDALTPNVISAVVEVLGLSPQEFARLLWQKVDMVDGHIVLVGIVVYKEGDVVEEDGQQVALTHKTALLLNKFIRLALPLDVTTMTKEQIIQHLRDVEAKMKADYEKTYGKAAPDVQHMDLENIEGDTIEEKLANVARQMQEKSLFEENDLAGFDYTKLTEEQRRQLQLARLSDMNNKKKVN